MYRELLSIIEKETSKKSIIRLAKEINRLERRFSYDGFHKSSVFCARQLRKYGAENVEVIPIPSDGVTTYMDCVMPQAWNITDATLEIIEPEDVPVKRIANLKEEPNCIANRSEPTSGEGIETEVVLEKDMYEGRDIKGKIVFIRERHPKEIKADIVKRGGVGIISGFSPAGSKLPNSTFWINGCGAGPGWYDLKGEKPLFCFSLSPRKAVFLERLIREKKVVRVKARIIARIYSGSIDTVTGVISGKSKKEILLLAHLYEPQASDDATGGAALIEILRVIKGLIDKGTLKQPRLSIRFLMSLELFGFSAFFAEKRRRKNILTAVNLDSFTFDQKRSGIPFELRMSPATQPFFGDILLKSMAEYYFKDKLPHHSWRITRGTFSDDTFMADTTIGIPVNWLYQPEGKYWHSSLNTFDKIDWEKSVRVMTLIATYAYFMASVGKKEIYWLADKISREGKRIILNESQKLTDYLTSHKAVNCVRIKEKIKHRLEFISSWQSGRLYSMLRLMDREKGIKKIVNPLNRELERTKREEISKIFSIVTRNVPLIREKPSKPSRIEVKASNIMLKRKTFGLPHCLARVPQEERTKRPPGVFEALNWVDGKRDLLEVMCLVEEEIDEKLTENQMQDIVRYFLLLAKYNYLKIRYRVVLDKKGVKKALVRLGLKRGDTVFVHSSLSALGYIKGGGDTIIDALLETIGQEGTLLMITHSAYFTTLYAGLGKRKVIVQAYNPQITPSGVGKISDIFWKRKGVLRSWHPTHSVSALGPLAEEMLSGHTKNSNPCHWESPFGKMVEHNGYFLFFGVEMTVTTFFHSIEDRYNLPYLLKAKVLVDNNGREEVVTIRGFPSGHRDFYTLPNKIMTRLKQEKADIRVEKVGLGEIKLVGAKELYQKTSAVLKREPDVFLCDNPKCDFCSFWRKRLKAGIYKDN